MKNLLIFAVIVLVAQVGYTQVAGVASALEPKASLAVADVDNQNFDFGKINFKECHLVYNDWYQRDELVKEIHEFRLK